MIDELDHLYRKGVSQHHIECLRKFDSLKGQMITDSRRLRGAKGGIKIPSDHIVTNSYYLHSLIRGVYKPESDPFALSIQTNPNSKWGKEIDGLDKFVTLSPMPGFSKWLEKKSIDDFFSGKKP